MNVDKLFNVFLLGFDDLVSEEQGHVALSKFMLT